MIERIAGKPYLGLIVIAFLVVVSLPIQNRIDNIRGDFRLIEQTVFLTPSSLKKLSLGYEQLMADIYWLRAIQYFGSSKVDMMEKDPEVLYQYFDIITDLDPQFINAYRFGGTFLAEPPPIGLGYLQKGIKLYDKGRRNNPDNFRLPLEEAFLYYLYAKDYQRASELFREAADKPGLSDFRSASIRGMAATSLKRGGDIEVAKKIWEFIYNTSENEGRRRYALQNMRELGAKEKQKKLTDILNQYIKDTGVIPDSLQALKDAGYIEKIPVDYGGNKYVIAKKIPAVRSPTLAKKELEENIGFYSAKAARYKKNYGDYPESFSELREYIINESTFIEFRPNPMGGGYRYDPETGKVTYEENILK